MYKERSEHQQRGARNAALNPKTKIDATVWKKAKQVDSEEQTKVAFKIVEAKLADAKERVARMQRHFGRTGERDPNYEQAIANQKHLARRLRGLQIELTQQRRDRKRKDVERLVSAIETTGDVFKRVARVMLAEDVFNRIAKVAGEEWERLYNRAVPDD